MYQKVFDGTCSAVVDALRATFSDADVTCTWRTTRKGRLVFETKLDFGDSRPVIGRIGFDADAVRRWKSHRGFERSFTRCCETMFDQIARITGRTREGRQCR